MCLQEQIEIEIKKGTIEKDPLIIINGQSIGNQKEFDILKKLDCSEIEEIEFMSSEKSKMKFDGEKARRGIVLVLLTKKGGRLWKKYYKLID